MESIAQPTLVSQPPATESLSLHQLGYRLSPVPDDTTFYIIKADGTTYFLYPQHTYCTCKARGLCKHLKGWQRLADEQLDALQESMNALFEADWRENSAQHPWLSRRDLAEQYHRGFGSEAYRELDAAYSALSARRDEIEESMSGYAAGHRRAERRAA